MPFDSRVQQGKPEKAKRKGRGLGPIGRARLAKLEAWREEMIATGTKAPSLLHSPGIASVTHCAREADVPQPWLRYQGRARLNEIAAEVGCAPVRGVVARANAAARTPELRARLDAWAQGRRDSAADDKRLPESKHKPGVPSAMEIARQANVTKSFILGPVGRRMLSELAEEFGVGDVPRQTCAFYPLSRLGKEARLWREGVLLAEGRSPLQVRNEAKNITWAVNRAARHAGPEGLGAEAPPAVAAALAEARAQKEYRLAGQLELLRTFLEDHLASDGLPAEFYPALKAACLAAGITVFKLSVDIGVNIASMSNWRNSEPSRRWRPAIRRAETVLGLPKGTLIGRAKHRSTRRRPVPSAAWGGLTRASVVGQAVRDRLGDDDLDLPLEALRARIAELAAEVEAALSPETLRRRGQTTRPYHIALPPAAARQFERVVRVKTSLRPIPGDLDPGRRRWRENTIVFYRNALESFFGFLALPPATEAEAFGGLGLDVSTGHLGWLLSTRAVELWLKFKSDRNGGMLGSVDHGVLIVLRGWMNPKKGLISQQADIAPLMKELSAKLPAFEAGGARKREDVVEVLSAEEAASAQIDWPAACSKAYDDYADLIERWTPAVRPSKVRQKQIEALLSQENPLSIAALITSGLARTASTLSVGSSGWCYLTRDRLYAGIQSHCALRTFTLRQVELSHLGFDKRGVLVIRIPRELFKNADSKAVWETGEGVMQEFFTRELDDVDGLYQTYRDYIDVARARLTKSPESCLLFVSEDGAMVRRLFFTTLCHQMARKHVIWSEDNPSGVQGISTFPNHGWRDILATHMWKATGSWDLAAYAIMDSREITERIYARRRTDHYDEELAAVLRTGLRSPFRPHTSRA